MKLRLALFLLLFCATFALAADDTKPAKPETQADTETETKPAVKEKQGPHLPALPIAVTANAVTVMKSRGATLLFSFMGIGSKMTWDAVTNTAFYLDPDWDQWYPLKPVPGTAGRIGASAIGVRGNVYLFGGAVVDSQNRGLTVADVNVYDLQKQYWIRAEDMPSPVADSVIGSYRDRYVYLISGHSGNSLLPSVQIFDAEKNKWLANAPFPGTPVFGHAGAILDDTIVVVDGAYRNPENKAPMFLASDQCWLGKIDRHDPTKIEWSKLPAHPGAARFGIAAGISEKERKIYFSGGTGNPATPGGMGFDGKPSEPSAMTFAYDVRSAKWLVINDNTAKPIMNSRGLLAVENGLALVGGMEQGPKMIARVPLISYAPKAP